MDSDTFEANNYAYLKCCGNCNHAVSLHQCGMHYDVDCKLFQALQYCIIGDDSLCMQIISSLKRQVREQEDEFESAKFFMKILKTALKPADYRRKVKKIGEMWHEFEDMNKGTFPVLTYVRADDNVLRRMSNPIKD